MQILQNLSEPMKTSRTASGHAENIIQKRFRTGLKLTKLTQNAAHHPQNAREHLWTFRNHSTRLKIYDNTQVHLRRLHIVRERVRTFSNLSKHRITHKNISECLKTHPERQTKLWNLQNLFVTDNNGSDYARTSENSTERSWTVQNYSESMRAPQNTLKQPKKRQRTSQNIQKQFIIHENASECFRRTNNVRECLRTFSNRLKLLWIHEYAYEHPRTSEKCLITLWNFSEHLGLP